MKKKRRNTALYAKIPLPLFFLGLEKTPNVDDIFKVTELPYVKVETEEPHKKREIVQ